MDFIKFGNGAKVSNSSISENILVIDDLSKVETFIRVGDDAEIVRVNIDGNEIHTPESYALKIKSQRDKLFAELSECQDAIESIQNDIAKNEIKRALAAAAAQDLTRDGEWSFRRIISVVATTSKEVGVAVVSGVIGKYLGY